MGLLAPLFLLGLAAIAVPIVIHMIQRERKEVIEFPSLMFVRRIPFHSFRRQRIRHWFLLLLRCAALALLVLAFARPFVRSPALAAVTDGAREVVVLLDRSYSMGFGDHWERARDAARDAVDGLAPDDRATLIFFDSGAAAGPRSTTERASLRGLIRDAELGAGVTRYGPALKLAEGIFEGSELPRLEAVMISDFPAVGSRQRRRHPLPRRRGADARPDRERRGRGQRQRRGVLFQREYFSGRERVAVGAADQPRRRCDRGPRGVARDGWAAGRDAHRGPAGERVDDGRLRGGHPDRRARARCGPRGGGRPAGRRRLLLRHLAGAGRAGAGRRERASTPEADLYLTRALGIGSAPAFDMRSTTLAAFEAADLDDRQVVVLNDVGAPPGDAGRALADWVAAGGGLLVAAGERSAWPAGAPDLLPGDVGSPQDRAGRGGALGYVDYTHPIFEVFAAPRSGDVTTARFFRYRPIEPEADAVTLARFDDGQPALVERRVGRGNVLLWASGLDSFWNDLAKKPVYLPFVHRLTEYLADYRPPTPWFPAGQVLNLSEQEVALGTGGLAEAEFVVMSPSGRRIPVSAGDRAGFIDLAEQGLYEVHDARAADPRPLTLAVNVDLAESDLTAVDPEELASTLTGRVGQGREASAPVREISAGDLERRQSVWWYLLVAAFLLLVGETVVSNRLSRTVLTAD